MRFWHASGCPSEPLGVTSHLRARAARALRAIAFVPTRRLALGVALLAPLWLLSRFPGGAWIALGATVLLALAALIDVTMLPAARDLRVDRLLEPTVGVGDESELRYRIESGWGRPLIAALHDALPPAQLSGGIVPDERPMPPRGVAEIAATVRGMARGEAPLGDVALRARTPLGLVARTLRYERDDRVLVAPSLSGVRRFRWLAVHQRLAAVGVRSTPRRGEGRTFASLRDYVVGDDPRHIDWKASARRGHPITREYTVEQAQRGRGALQALRAALVPVQPSLVEPDYSAAFRALATRQRKRALLVMLTDVIDARAARSLLGHLTRGASRHLAVVVALRNEALLRAARLPEAPATRSLYASAAAEELITERATGLQRMRDTGVVVLDVAPDAMAAAVVNQYLELKARGTL